MSIKLDNEIFEMQKRLYKEEFIKDMRIKRGGKFYPFSVEHMATERDRLIEPMTDADRTLRKQWLEDQKLSPREPVNVPEWNRINIFRRAYHGFFDSITNIFKPVLGPQNTKNLRRILPKVVIPYIILCTYWYQIKYHPRIWASCYKGFRIDQLRRPKTFPGQSDFPKASILEHHFGDEEFSKRKIFIGDKLVTSGPNS